MKNIVLTCFVASILTVMCYAAVCPVFATVDTKDAKDTKAVSTKQDLKPFKTVNLAGIGNLHIKQSSEENFTVEAPDDILPLVSVYVKDGTLYIDLKDASKHTEAKINYYLNVKSIETIKSSSSATIYIPDGLETDTLNILIGNLGEAQLKINVKKLIAQIDGGGKIDVRGAASDQTFIVNAAGEINATKLSGKTTTVTIQGSGAVETNGSDKLIANIAGDGVVKYCGRPDVTKQISGKGIVEPLGGDSCP